MAGPDQKIEKISVELYEPGHCALLHMIPDKITRADSDSVKSSGAAGYDGGNIPVVAGGSTIR